MNINDAFSSKWLKAADLKGKAVNLTIKSYLMDTVKDKRGTKVCPTISFVGTEKWMILNVTNGHSIGDVYGDTDNWPGKVIQVYPTTTDMDGGRVACIRIRIPTAAIAVVPQTGLPVPEIAGSFPEEEPLDDDGSDIPF